MVIQTPMNAKATITLSIIRSAGPRTPVQRYTAVKAKTRDAIRPTKRMGRFTLYTRVLPRTIGVLAPLEISSQFVTATITAIATTFTIASTTTLFIAVGSLMRVAAWGGWPTQARFWLEWGSSFAAHSRPAARSRFLVVCVHRSRFGFDNLPRPSPRQQRLATVTTQGE